MAKSADFLWFLFSSLLAREISPFAYKDSEQGQEMIYSHEKFRERFSYLGVRQSY
jgi:hypothetical protein